MAYDEDDGEINFNELVGNLLSSHNQEGQEEGEVQGGEQEGDDFEKINPTSENIEPKHPDDSQHMHNSPDQNIEIPHFVDEEDELVSVVANAVQNIDDEQAKPENHLENGSEHVTSDTADDNHEKEQQQEWAHILQQEILKSDGEPLRENTERRVSTSQHHPSQRTDDALDQDDENLRMAILESLQELNTNEEEEKEPEKHEHAAPNDKLSSKKSSKKKKKDKSKNRESSKDKSSKKSKSSSHSKKHAKDRNKEKQSKLTNNENTLDLSNILENLIHENDNAAIDTAKQTVDIQDNSHTDNTNNEDVEAQALVEATLKAFENELLSSAPTEEPSQEQSIGPVSSTKAVEPPRKPTADDIPLAMLQAFKPKKRPPQEKKKTKSKTSKAASTANKSPASESTSKKKKKKKTVKESNKSQEAYEDDEFSRILADMVNQVVNTSLKETSTHTATQYNKLESESDFTSPVQSQYTTEDASTANDDSLDLNQIMQNAMAMVFQNQNDDEFDENIVEDFNRGLGDLSVSDLLPHDNLSRMKKKSVPKSSSKSEKKTAISRRASKKASRDASSVELTEVPSKPKKPSKTEVSLEKKLRKKYVSIANEAASVARKKRWAKNKELKEKEKLERQTAREERRHKKKLEKQRLAEEQEELKKIVERGPPYPPDLRLTKSGKPKKPYRRWTPEELLKRSQEAEKPRKVKKERKKKEKKMKVPSSALKKIPLFNFVKGNVQPSARHRLNDIEGSLSTIGLHKSPDGVHRILSRPKSEDHEWPLSDSSASQNYDAHLKTVVHKEKIPFHPPWTIPSQPPFALPVARRKKIPNIKKYRKRTNNSFRVSKEGTASTRNRILPAILLPIINTLKAAAKSQTAAGATPEEARKRLATIIQHAKSTVIRAALQARKNSMQAAHSKGTTTELATTASRMKNPLRMIPIFNTSRVKQQLDKQLPARSAGTEISSSESPDKATPDPHSNSTIAGHTLKGVTTPIKIEDSDANVPPVSIAVSTIEPSQDKLELTKRAESVEPVENNVETAKETQSVQEIKENVGTKASEEVTLTEDKTNGDPKNEKRILIESPVEKTDKKKPGEKIATDLNEDASLSDKKDGDEKSTLHSDAAQLTGNEPDSVNTTTGKPKLIDVSLKPLNEAKPKIPIIFPLKRPQIKPEVSVINLVQNLVNTKIPEIKNESVDLGSNITDILSSTITNILPEITATDVKNYQYEDENVKYLKKTPRQVLNLDGLVPPSGRCITKAKRVRRIKKLSADATTAPEADGKANSESITYTFDIPSPEEVQSKRSVVLKFAKARLTEAELSCLKKEINNVRKRRWREMNSTKNWEYDVKSRLKKRANAFFGEGESETKSKWIEERFQEKVSQEKYKDRLETTETQANNTKIVIDDKEILNILAINMNNLNKARCIEKDIQESFREEKLASLQPKKKRKKSILH
ncbi:ALI_HP2_G0032940.mRNA.1.CDS.1 [Saccharomyces cerevisiae]|nr:ALI_HP2_G0032940.mRNA.1.CDS.1 [Saccharomyces cerevisiae]CAI6451939.1 ALI_HP1_G0013450.mRNA.1.CDS.1 [Saccharomyces cerevisiae]CAI6596977.1 ALI_collapsed_G0014270.mRNA.1.CDS.1 [Saccharomyces cerevisiae]CAI6740547.1 ALI_HP2_G0032940.mRNA.1.CDS.1 [Saccharomyces cerevisiae]